MTPMRPEKQLLDRWVDLAPVVALLVVVPAVLLALTNSAGHVPNPDSYYHAGAARLYAEQGWLSSFPWLEHTALGAHFPNVYLLQHLLLAPLAYWDSTDDVMSHGAIHPRAGQGEWPLAQAGRGAAHLRRTRCQRRSGVRAQSGSPLQITPAHQRISGHGRIRASE